MFARLLLGALGCAALVQAGCGRSDSARPASRTPSADAQTITLHVEGMAKTLNLF
jgi:hypothetical protein